MGTIYMSLDSSIVVTEATAFIEYINGQEPHIHEFWCLGLVVIFHKAHTTSRV